MDQVPSPTAVCVGVRVEKDAVNWAVVKGSVDAPRLSGSGRLKSPHACDDEEVEAIAWFYQPVVDLLEEHGATSVAIRYAEHGRRNVGKADFQRARIEGIVILAAKNSGLRVVVGPLKSISTRLGSDSAKAYIQQKAIRGVDLSGTSTNVREAAVVAVSGLGE